MTAVEWLLNEFQEVYKDHGGLDVNWLKRFEKAKEMEEQQIIDAWESGYVEGAGVNDFSIYHGNVYYNNTFKIKKDF